MYNEDDWSDVYEDYYDEMRNETYDDDYDRPELEEIEETEYERAIR